MIELYIIECILTDNSTLKEIYGYVKPEMFENEICREAFQICLQMYEHSEPITPVELAQRLETKERTQTEALEFIRGLMHSDCLTVHIKKYGNALIRQYRATELKKVCQNLSFLPKDSESDIAELMATCERLKQNQNKRYNTLSNIAKHSKEYYFHEHPDGLKLGLYELDEIISGLEKKDVTIIGARPSVGKSAFATQIVLKLAEEGHRVGYFNLEMSEKQIFERLLAKLSGLKMTRIRKAKSFLNDEKERYDKAIAKLEGINNLLIFSGSYSANDIKSECNNQNFDLIVIDYLQLVKPDKAYGNRVAEVGNVSKSIKEIAMSLDVPIIALSQLNRSKSATDEPELADLRESGDIEQDASNVLFLWNMEENGKTKGIKVAKNRQGVLGKVGLSFDGDKMEFLTISKKFNGVEQDVKRHEQFNRDNPFENGAYEDM